MIQPETVDDRAPMTTAPRRKNTGRRKSVPFAAAATPGVFDIASIAVPVNQGVATFMASSVTIKTRMMERGRNSGLKRPTRRAMVALAEPGRTRFPKRAEPPPGMPRCPKPPWSEVFGPPSALPSLPSAATGSRPLVSGDDIEGLLAELGANHVPEDALFPR